MAGIQKPTVKSTPTTDKIITDSNGRQLAYRKLNLVENARFMRACGQHASNDSFFNLAILCACIRAVSDSEGEMAPLPMPTNLNEIDGRIGLIGDDGFNALSTAIIEEIQQVQEEAGAKADQTKNS